MEVTIKIPEFIINLCKECGFDEKQTQKLFRGYINEISNDGYGQFNTNFEDWLQDDEDCLIQEILGEDL